MRYRRVLGLAVVAVALVVVGCGPAPQTSRMSVSTNGTQGNQGSFSPSISDNGRYVAYLSNATNLVNGDSNGVTDVFVRDRQQNTTQRVMGMGQVQPNGGSGDIPEGYGTTFPPMVGNDGRFVVFHSRARNLITGQTGNGVAALYVKDRTTGTVRKIVAGVPRFGISADARWIAYWANETEFVVYDALNNAYRYRSFDGGCYFPTAADDGGDPCTYKATREAPEVSPDGRWVAFIGSGSVQVWDVTTNTVQSPTETGDWTSNVDHGLRMAADGSRVYWDSLSHEYWMCGYACVDPETGCCAREYVSTWDNGTWSLEFRGATVGKVGDPGALPRPLDPSWSADGKIEALRSFEKNLVPNDTNNVQDVFARVHP